MNSIEAMIKNEKITMRFDQTMSKLNNMSDLEESFVPDLNRIKFIETAVKVVDSKVNTCLIESKKLDETLQKLDQLSAKTSLLEPEIDRIKLIEKSVDLAENNKLKLINQHHDINAIISSIEPELSKINTIELSMEKFDSKQDKLISILLNAIYKKKLIKFFDPKFKSVEDIKYSLSDMNIFSNKKDQDQDGEDDEEAKGKDES